MEEEDYSKFDPKEHWKEINNEPISGLEMSRKDKNSIDRMIVFLKEERTLEEMILHLGLKRVDLVRLLNMMKFIKNIGLNRSQLKGCMGYQVEDFRSPSEKKSFNSDQNS